MTRRVRPALPWFIALVALAPWLSIPAGDDKEEPRPPQRPLTRQECDKLADLTPDQLRQQLGPARHVNRQILYHRYLEQWIYEQPYLVRVEIDYARGRKPQILTVQPGSRESPEFSLAARPAIPLPASQDRRHERFFP